MRGTNECQRRARYGKRSDTTVSLTDTWQWRVPACLAAAQSNVAIRARQVDCVSPARRARPAARTTHSPERPPLAAAPTRNFGAHTQAPRPQRPAPFGCRSKVPRAPVVVRRLRTTARPSGPRNTCATSPAGPSAIRSSRTSSRRRDEPAHRRMRRVFVSFSLAERDSPLDQDRPLPDVTPAQRERLLRPQPRIHQHLPEFGALGVAVPCELPARARPRRGRAAAGQSDGSPPQAASPRTTARTRLVTRPVIAQPHRGGAWRAR